MASSSSSARAGGYAEARYERGLRTWRSRIRLPLAVCFGPFIVAGLAGLVIAGHPIAWVAGATFGLGAAAAMAIRESPPAYIENWQLGAQGEQKTENALKPLEPPQWLVVHDVECDRGNYDHILVGRAGVFMLDTKNPQGIVHIREGQPYLRRRSDPEADTRCPSLRTSALASAASLHQDLKRRTGLNHWVKAVVVLWSDFDEGLHEDEKCVLVHGSRLHDWLTSRPDSLDQATADQLAAVIQAIADESGSGG
jgi:hypothetical protein